MGAHESGRARATTGFAVESLTDRLEAQDTALSRRRHGFESRWGHLLDGRSDWTDRLKCLLAEMLIRAISSVVERLPYKEEVAGSNPASPTQKKRHFAGKMPRQRERPGYCPGLLTST